MIDDSKMDRRITTSIHQTINMKEGNNMEREKKGNKKILIAIALLLLLSVCFTTYAIYRSTATAQGTINTANWSVKVNGTDVTTASQTVTVSFADCTFTNGKNGKMAPGDTCTKNITVDATGSEVGVVVEATTGTVSPALPTGFTVDVTVPSDGKISYNADSMTATIPVKLTWTGTVDDAAAKDATDVGFKAQTVTVPVTLTVRQQVNGN